MTDKATATTWRRVPPMAIKRQTTLWCDPRSKAVLSEQGEPLGKVRDLCGAIDLARTLGADALYLLGGTDAGDTPPSTSWDAPIRQGWASVGGERVAPPSRAYSRDGVTVRVYMTGAWFEDNSDLDRCRRAWLALWRMLRRGDMWGTGGHVFPTPASTGINLLAMSLPRGREYETLPADVRARIRGSATQGRTEVFTAHGHVNASAKRLPALYELDGRFMYAACLRYVPSGPYVHETGHDLPFAGYTPAFYWGTFTVPDGWATVGPLPAPTAPWSYPWEAGHTWEGMATGAELHTAMRHGWVWGQHIRITERITWPDAGKGDPLREWAERIRKLRQEAADNDDLAPLLRDALRHVLIDTIGALHREDTYTAHASPCGEDVPADAFDVGIDGGVWTWKVRAPLKHLRHCHPEISAYVWGRTRARLADALMRLPSESLVAAFTDGAWVTCDPGWADDGRDGSFRVKSSLSGPVPAPRGVTAMNELKHRARGAKEL